MKWITAKGKVINLNITKYLIDYDSDKGSSGEVSVRKFLKKHSSTHIWTEQLPIKIGGPRAARLDFMSPDLKLCIEIDGDFHNSFDKGKFFYNNSKINYLNSIKRDVKKEEMLELNGIKVVRVEYSDLPLTPAFFLEKYDIYI